MKISVVIPTFNRSKVVLNTLEALHKQTLTDDEMEVIVVDDGSVDNTVAVVDSWIANCPRKNFHLIGMKVNSGRAAVCNTGVRAATSPYVLFTDDDCLPDPDWAEHHLNLQKASRVPIGVAGAVHFPELWVKKSNFVRYFEARYLGNRPWSTVKGSAENIPPNLMGGLVSYSRESILSVGLFNERMGRGQDGELAYRLWKAGVKFIFDQRPRIVHVSPDMESFDVWLFKYLKFYDRSFSLIKELCPEFQERFGHWFLNAPVFGQEPLQRTLIKLGIRTICNKHLAGLLRRYLNRTDKYVHHYHPRLYLYVITTFSLEKIRECERLCH